MDLDGIIIPTKDFLSHFQHSGQSLRMILCLAMACQDSFKLWEAQNFLISLAYNFLPGWRKVGRRHRREGETKDISLNTSLKLFPYKNACEGLKNVEEAVVGGWELLWDRAVCSFLFLCPQGLTPCWAEQKLHTWYMPVGEPGVRSEKECASYPQVLADVGEQRKWTRWSSRLLFSKTCVPWWTHPLSWWPKCEVLLCFPILVSCLRIRVFPAEGIVRGIRLNSVFRNGSLSVFFFLSSFSCPEWVQRLEWIMFLYPWHIIIMGLLRFLCFIYTSITFSHSLWPTKVPIDNR